MADKPKTTKCIKMWEIRDGIACPKWVPEGTEQSLYIFATQDEANIFILQNKVAELERRINSLGNHIQAGEKSLRYELLGEIWLHSRNYVHKKRRDR